MYSGSLLTHWDYLLTNELDCWWLSLGPTHLNYQLTSHESSALLHSYRLPTVLICFLQKRIYICPIHKEEMPRVGWQFTRNRKHIINQRVSMELSIFMRFHEYIYSEISLGALHSLTLNLNDDTWPSRCIYLNAKQGLLLIRSLIYDGYFMSTRGRKFKRQY